MPSTKYLRCLIYPLKNAFTSSSNIPLVTFISKLCLYPRQFPLFPNKSGTFIPSRPGWRTKFFKYFAQLGILLHLLGCLNWFKIQWFDHKQCGVVTPTWKFMLVTCSMIIFAAESLSFPHIDQVKMHLVTLLNSAMSVEIKLQRGVFNNAGNLGRYVTTYFVLMGACITWGVGFILPAVFILSLLQPCMPPLISAFAFVPCTSWTDDGAATGFLIKAAVGIYEMYMWSVLIGISAFVFMIMILYPVEVNLLLLKDMERNWRNFVQLRTLQMLSNLQNFVFAAPSMGVIIGTLTLLESCAIYILMKSGELIPLPIFVLLSIAAIDYLIVILGIFKIGSNPYVKSMRFIQLTKTNKLSKYEVAFIKSCPPSKLSLGDGRFFDRLTSFVIWQKCIDWIITFLLM
ncbi:hypothetical protein Fcan01_09085 [Folsomia candida]|uniref:Uncharacterized protein n=1 Tax=Folsomia candida TaxID=158441 RepID=A0A226EED7_FOLCA|nr:hypothetical protein Fcan01_09085 [Folsomia candida]